MSALFSILGMLTGIGSLVCFVIVLVKMFQKGQTGLGIACAVLILCGVGALIAFVYGWIKATEWDIKNIMLAWTGCIVAGILFQVLAFATAAAAV